MKSRSILQSSGTILSIPSTTNAYEHTSVRIKMLFKSFSLIGVFLLLTIRITLATDFGCFGGEKFTDLKNDGDLNGTAEVFCNETSSKDYHPGLVVSETGPCTIQRDAGES